MINTRRVTVEVQYNKNKWPEPQQAGDYIESLTYVDSASDNSDSIDITFDASDPKWLGNEQPDVVQESKPKKKSNKKKKVVVKDNVDLGGWMPDKGAKIKATIIGSYWDSTTGTGTHKIKCGQFILDDVSYSDGSSKMSIGGVSKPADEDFSEQKREKVWKYTSIKRIGRTIAKRYGLNFTYDATDYSIETEEQDATDSSFYNTLCKNYGLILKVYSAHMWVYDREAYKKKKPIKTYGRSDITQGSLKYSTTLYGTYTGGYFEYTDSDKDIDIIAEIGSGTHTKNVSRKATSVLDASIQLCADINNANHGKTKITFSVPGEWKVSSGSVIRLTDYGSLNGKYFVDKVTHKYDTSSGFSSDIVASKVEKSFNYWDVGGRIEVHEKDEDEEEEYTSTYENMKSEAAGAQPGQAVTLTNAPFYVSSTAPEPACYKSGTFYFYDGNLQGGRYRMTISADRCGKLPVGENVTGWVPASYCGVGAAQDSTQVGAAAGSVSSPVTSNSPAMVSSGGGSVNLQNGTSFSMNGIGGTTPPTNQTAKGSSGSLHAGVAFPLN